MSVRIFMDVNIGDAEAYKIAMEAYRRAESFLSEVSSQYGFPSTIEALEDEQKDLLQEAYAADPLWSGKGEMSAAKPASINAGRLIIQLNDNVPKTTENFRCLITGEKGKGKSSGKPLHYKGSCFHRIIKGFVCQGGDIVKGDGSGGDSIYNGKFNDEKPGLKGKHDSIGVLSMANSGKNSNTSQFYFTLAPNPKMDGKHVVFGKIVQGIDILQRIDDEAASEDGTPKVEVSIADCGEVPVT